jgi:hypothetical protein
MRPPRLHQCRTNLRYVAAALLFVPAAMSPASLRAQIGNEPSDRMAPHAPAVDSANEVVRLPPVTSTEEELLQLEQEAARIIAMDEALHGTNDDVPATTLCATWLAPGGAAGFGNADFNLTRTLHWQPSEVYGPVLITPGCGLHLWSGPDTLDLPPRVYDLYVDLTWRCDREFWGITAGITPGLYGDFVRLDGKAFQLTGWVLGDWTLSEQWSLVGGLAYVRQLQSHLLPIGGAIWRPSDDLRLDIIFPRPRVSWRWFQTPDHDVWLYLAGVFGGGAWSVDGGAQSNVLVQYSDLRLTLGTEIAHTGGKVAELEVGYVFSRDISVESTSLASPSATLLLQASIAY